MCIGESIGEWFFGKRYAIRLVREITMFRYAVTRKCRRTRVAVALNLLELAYVSDRSTLHFPDV